MEASTFIELSKDSFTMTTTFALLEFTNDTKDKPAAELVGKKILAAVCLIALPFVGLIEAFVRGIFAIPVLFGLLIPEGKCRDWYIKHLFEPLAVGCLMSLAMVPGLFAMNYWNIAKKHVEKEHMRKAFHLLANLTDGDGKILASLVPPAPKYACCKSTNNQFSYDGGQ